MSTMVTIETKGFEANVPVIQSIDLDHLNAIVNSSDPIASFLNLKTELRKVLADEKIQQFDELELLELVNLAESWLRKSREALS